MAKKKFGYMMSASGYGSKTYSYATRDEAITQMRSDAESTAAEYDGELQDFGDEIAVVGHDGDEITRFELLA